MENKHNDLTLNDDGKLYFNPYNPNNKEITEKDIQNILFPHLGFIYNVYNIELFKRAFVHRSYCKLKKDEKNNIIIAPKPNNCLNLKSKSNERLEFLGDGVLENITKYYLYNRFPNADEGFMTEKKISLVKNENIGKLAFDLNLQKHYIISKHAEEKKIRNNYKKLGCLFEAFLGALFLDANKVNIDCNNEIINSKFIVGCGFQISQIFINSIYEKYIDWNNLIELNDNFKNNFQVILQKEFKNTPSYIILNYNDINKNEDEDDNNNDINEDTSNVFQINQNLILNHYEMGVYLIIGYSFITYKQIHNAIIYGKDVKSFTDIHNYLNNNGQQIILFFSKGSNKIKKKAEQDACEIALKIINS